MNVFDMMFINKLTRTFVKTIKSFMRLFYEKGWPEPILYLLLGVGLVITAIIAFLTGLEILNVFIYVLEINEYVEYLLPNVFVP